MADWYNLRLEVTGLPADLLRFRRAAGALIGRIDTSRGEVFRPEMEHGETTDLVADRPAPFHVRWRTVAYRFQGRSTTHVNDIRMVAARFPKLAFVLTYGDAMESHGSYLLIGGTTEGYWAVPKRTARTAFRRHYERQGLRTAAQIEADTDAAFCAETAAGHELMDVAARHWDGAILNWLREKPSRRA